MENMLYNAIRQKGYLVDVGLVEIWEKNKEGKNVRKQLEVDFVINRADERVYIQSAYMLPDEEKWLQEKRPLLSIPDSFKKMIITGEYRSGNYNDDGIYIIGWHNFLLEKNNVI